MEIRVNYRTKQKKIQRESNTRTGRNISGEKKCKTDRKNKYGEKEEKNHNSKF